VLAALTDPEILASLLALSALEIVLGIDNIIFIAIMVQRLPEARRKLAYRVGLGGALLGRLALLATLSWIMRLKTPLFSVLGRGVSGRDLMLLGGGAFLVIKASHEIFTKVEHRDVKPARAKGGTADELGEMAWLVGQIMLIDIIFSVDSVITAVGIARELWVMATAMILAVFVMMIFAKRLGDFVNRHPSMQVLALSFLLLVGVLLVAEGFGQHVSKGYVYFAMAFSLLVELFNLRFRKKGEQIAESRRLESERFGV
jgi:predicted tellurium resistance membrane protein TerC